MTQLTRPGSPTSHGSLHLTPHHVVFRPSEVATTVEQEVWLPLSLLHSVTRTPPTLDGSPTPLVLKTRDFQTFELAFQSVEQADGVWDSLKGVCQAVATAGVEQLYAFTQKDKLDRKGKSKAGWNIYEPEKEFKRMGVGNRSQAWRVSLINANFDFCPSYPSDIVVPSRISDMTLSYAVKYRSKGRIPGLVYLHWANFGSITRSSQPMVGITQGARSIQDEKLVEAIFSSHPQHSGRQTYSMPSASSSSSSLDTQSGPLVYGATATNIIIDARPSKNAYANSVKGAGTENMSFYRNCRKEYLGIDNIHVMRSSLNGLYSVLRAAETTGFVDRNALRQTHWLSHLVNILDGTLIIVRTIHVYNSHVLVHCSDGWDRTSQLSALPQVCLDPYYRTAQGFAVLIEKDWISYGHRFSDRAGHLCADRVQFVQERREEQTAQQAFIANVTKQFQGSSHAFKETCPVFQQFLDCTYQLLRQFPDRFEFNERFLVKLEYETYNSTYGTFLFNSEKDRRDLRARERTPSVWQEFFEETIDVDGQASIKLKDEYVNDKYDTSLDEPTSKNPNADQGVLFVNPHDVKWWFGLFGRTDEEMNGPPMPASNVPSTLVNGETRTEVKVVHSAGDDPVLTKLGSNVTNLDLNATSPVSSSSLLAPPVSPPTLSARSPSPTSGATRIEIPTQAQFNEAVSSVQKFGWSAWKAVKKYGEEAASRYGDNRSTISPSQSEPSAGSHKAWQQAGATNAENPWAKADEQRGTSNYAVYKSSTASSRPTRVEQANPWAVEHEHGEPVLAVNRRKPAVADEAPKESKSVAIDPLGVGLS
ncbi:phosphatidylinositol-3-phosphatase ymr1 [Microbotryomycetes sp. JL201]|nr:phosphatidylinositol-3-phosphatase ymr1 [Microbotryomycetes sp. JL201]